MIFLSMPYRSTNQNTVEKRLKLGRKVVSELLSDGVSVQCPVVAFHETLKEHGGTTDYEAWQTVVEELIVKSTKMLIIRMPGYLMSEGVRDEVQIAEKYGRQWDYYEPRKAQTNNIKLPHTHDEVRRAAMICKGEEDPGYWQWAGNTHLDRNCNCDHTEDFSKLNSLL